MNSADGLPRLIVASGFMLLLSCLMLSPLSAGEETDLAERIDRFPPVEPDEALQTFAVEDGFRLELIAAEPKVADPVDACFDADGRMYVAEMRGYPYSHERRQQQPKKRGRKDAGAIRLLEDTTGDGRLNRSVVFAEDISWPQSVCCYDGGVFVIAPPHIDYFKDTDGDGRADVREVVYSGFSRHNVQALANNMKWSLDNHIYAAGGRSGADLTHRGEKLFKLGRRDFRFDPATEELEPVSGGGQFGHSFDNWGNRFVCSNSNHIQQVIYPHRYLARNPYLAVSGVVRGIAKRGGAAPVYRRSPPESWRVVRTKRRAADPKYRNRLPKTELVPVGYFTSATGVTIYRGDAYPEQYRGNAFIGDVGGNLVHRKLLKPRGATFLAVRADEKTEFIASTDTWFRPVNFVNAPDGTLYILDMYRETIEHPYSIPEDIKQHLDLESGHKRGRIYRLVPPDWQYEPPPQLAGATVAELVGQLESLNAWNRQTAQRLLWERQDPSAVAPLRKLIRTSKSPWGRLHALWTLDGLEALTPEGLIAALSDPHAGVREHAVRLSEDGAHSSPELREALLRRTDDAAYRVRFQLAFSLGELPGKVAVPGLAKLARNEDFDRDLRTALLTSVAETSGQLAGRLLQDVEFLERNHAGSLLGELARITGTRKEEEPSLQLLAAVVGSKVPLAIRRRVIDGLGDGLQRRGSSIASLLKQETADSQLREQIAALFHRAEQTARDENLALRQRKAAIALLARADYETASTLEKLLTPRTPQALQLAVVEALAEQQAPEVGELLIAGWRSYSPPVRRAVVDALLGRVSRLKTLMAALESGTVRPGELRPETRQRLRNHSRQDIRDRAQQVFQDLATKKRAEVVAEYQQALQVTGNPERGRKIFLKNCAACHQVGEQGHQVGPELASTRNKSPGDLLISILDPNREAQPNYISYSVVTRQGKLLNGIIADETPGSLTLRQAEGKEETVLRTNVAAMASDGVSLMPEGLEQEISPQEMADLIAFVRQIQPRKSASE